MRRGDDARALEAIGVAYRHARDDEAWLRQIARAVRAALDDGMGVVAGLYDAADSSGLRFRSSVSLGAPQWPVRSLLALNEAAPAHAIRRTFLGTRFGTTSELLGRSWQELFDRERYDRLFGCLGDAVGINGLDPSGAGCVIIVPLARQRRSAGRERIRWSRVAAHVAAGLRLRGNALVTLLDPFAGAEAILDSENRMVHAEGLVRDAGEVVGSLRRAALAMDRARSRRTDPDEGARMWKALVEGRWSVVEVFDSDRRRFFVVHRNDPSVRRHAALTVRERQVVAYAALGHANKLIGYELGLSTSTVANHLADAAAKLGVRSRLAVIRLYLGTAGADAAAAKLR